MIATTIHPTEQITTNLYHTLTDHLLHLETKLIKTMHNTGKSDKYFRLASNAVKYIRAMSAEQKKRYSAVYKQLLIVRQIIRWNNIYNTSKEIYELGWQNVHGEHITTLLFSLLEMFGDLLDRCIFVLELIGKKQYQGRLSRMEQLECDCYFIQCAIWLFYHLRTFGKIWKKGDYELRKNKVLKVAKYIIDSMTSYTKFSRRTWELSQKSAAILGIISSLIGLYDILK